MLYSDLDAMIKKLPEEFPEVISIGSLGQSWEHRDLMFIKLDARQAVANKNGSGLAQAPSQTEKKETPSASTGGDPTDDLPKSFSGDMSNIFL